MSKRLVIGWAAVMFVLSGTGVFYFLGLKQAGVTPTMAVPPPGGCGPGGFCGRSATGPGGCSTITCCPEGQTICGPDRRAGSSSFPKVEPYGLGTCYAYDGPEQTWCTYYACAGSTSCPSSDCRSRASVREEKHATPRQVGGQCVPAM